MMLEPSASSTDVSAARYEMDDAAFRRDRLQEAVRRLGERVRELRREEEQARRLLAYNEAAAVRRQIIRDRRRRD
jgi:hypothetical protein